MELFDAVICFRCMQTQFFLFTPTLGAMIRGGVYDVRRRGAKAKKMEDTLPYSVMPIRGQVLEVSVDAGTFERVVLLSWGDGGVYLYDLIEGEQVFIGAKLRGVKFKPANL